MHLKRQRTPKNWPIFRKGTKYVVRPASNFDRGIPVLIVLRDMLKVAKNRKEAKRAIHLRQVLINNKSISDEKTTMVLFDTIALVPMKKYYKLGLLQGGKFDLVEIKENETNHKIAKLIDKKMLKGKKIQLNLDDGRNFISQVSCNVGDSLVVNFKDKKVEKCIPLKEDSTAYVFSGKHAGKSGSVKKIYKEKGVAEIEIDEKPISVLIKQFMVIK